MVTLDVVEMDVILNSSCQFVLGIKLLEVIHLGFKQSPITLHWAVVNASADSGHSGVFRWPRNETEARLLTEQEIRWLMEGLEIEQPKAIKEGKPGALY